MANSGPPSEIKVDKSQKALNSPASSSGNKVYFALIVSVLAATFGVTWIILNALVASFNGSTTASGTAKIKRHRLGGSLSICRRNNERFTAFQINVLLANINAEAAMMMMVMVMIIAAMMVVRSTAFDVHLSS